MSTTEVVRIQRNQPALTAEEEQGRLRTDLQYLRRKGLFKASGEFALYQSRKCVRCGAPFGRFYNTGAPCTRCRHRVCRQCRIEARSRIDNKDVEWICTVCYKITELYAITDKWIYDAGSLSRKISSSPVEFLKHSIRRAWTINGPPARWTAARKSPEQRIYRSLPSRHQKYRDPTNGTEDTTISETKISQADEKRSRTIDVGEQSEESTCRANDNLSKDANDDDSLEKLVRVDTNEQTNSKRVDKLTSKQKEEVPLLDVTKHKKSDRSLTIFSGKVKNDEQDDNISQESSSHRPSLIKPPRILSKLISPDTKQTQAKHGERKSNIPIFKRSSKEFEDIRSPQESPRRSLIPQRYRGSTDDLRRSREDISVPSLIPKLLSPRHKEERLKRQDSKDDIRQPLRASRKDEGKSPVTPSGTKEDSKHGLRVFRREGSREGSREDVGREISTSNATNGLTAPKGKQTAKEEKFERGEERVGFANAFKFKQFDQGKTKFPGKESKQSSDGRKCRSSEPTQAVEQDETLNLEVDNNQEMMIEGSSINEKTFDGRIGKHGHTEDRVPEIGANDTVVTERNDDVCDSCVNTQDSMKDTTGSLLEDSEVDGSAIGVNEKKYAADVTPGKKLDDFQVVRRKFSKEEFSNPDDTDETPNKRCSSHLSPEASPLSTRSSRYSPRESESEPTPALPRKTGDSSSASQRIRDAITKTRRESNSSTRYESSGSESIRLSETGFHGYVELARKVKFFGGSGSGLIPSIIGNDEVVQRDSATSAGEDEPHDDGHNRTGPASSQGRSVLRRRRQFDAQGSRRRGRSHARNYCSEELQGSQALHVISRGGRQHSPTRNQGQDQSTVDYRRLVFISSDSSSGREEDDADSSCSSSSYLNGLPRSGSGHAPSLEDCDWDYFESGSLPLPSEVPLACGSNNVATETGVPQDWSCCPGRGSAACQACGGSRSTNVLPVPVPIPVPVPYPVPVPAALWTGEFVAAASSMISRSSDTHTEPGTLRLRGDPAAPWFAWHPRFNQPLHGTRLDPRLTSAFDPTTCTFRPDQVLAPCLYGPTVETSTVAPSGSDHLQQRHFDGLRTNDDEHGDENGDCNVDVIAKTVGMSSKEAPLDVANEAKLADQNIIKARERPEENICNSVGREIRKDDEHELEDDEDEDAMCQKRISTSFKRREQRIYSHSLELEHSGSSSGRSSADSSDLEDDSSTHRFSRVFVVNDDSLTSDNDIEDNADEGEESDFAAEGGVTLKRMTALPEEEPCVLQYVRLLNEDGDVDVFNGISTHTVKKQPETNFNTYSVVVGDEGKLAEPIPKSTLQRNTDSNERRKPREKKSSSEENNEEKQNPILENNKQLEEIYLASDTDNTDHQIQLKSIKSFDPDSIEISANVEKKVEIIQPANAKIIPKETIPNNTNFLRSDLNLTDLITDESNDSGLTEEKPSASLDNNVWDSNIIPDSLEISGTETLNNHRIPHNGSTNVSTVDDPIVSTSAVIQNIEFANCDVIIDKNCGERVLDKSIDFSSIGAIDSSACDDNDKYVMISDSNLVVSATPSISPSSAEASFTSNTSRTNKEATNDEYECELPPAVFGSSCHNNAVFSAFNTEMMLHLTKKNTERSIAPGNSSQNDETCVNSELVIPDTKKQDSIPEASGIGQSADNSSDSVASTSAKDESAPTSTPDDQSVTFTCEKSVTIDLEDVAEENSRLVERSVIESKSAVCDVDAVITSETQEMFKTTESAGKVENAHDSDLSVVGEENVGSSQVVGEVRTSKCGGSGGGSGGGSEDGSGSEDSGALGGRSGGCVEEGLDGGSTRFRSVERRPSVPQENGFFPVAAAKDSVGNVQHLPSTANCNNNIGSNNNNKYKSFVMITQETSYQPVSVITSDTTTLLQPDDVHSAGQGLAGYFQLALEAVTEQPHRKNGQGPRKPLMVKRLASVTTNQSEPEADSGLSVGSASESDDVSVKNATKINSRLENNNDAVAKERQVNEIRESARPRVSSQSSDENSGNGGVVILEEGLADDDSWVEEVSHDEDEPGATTATEESSEDETNNLGDREEELRGYHRQAIDFTLHTIVEESCEESEAEPSLSASSPSKKQRPASASELEKYFCFGIGGDGNNSSMGSREVDSLSETSSIYSEGCESLGHDESPGIGQNQERSNSGESFMNSSRLEQYFLSGFLGIDQDRRDSDGSVGSDSEGRPSPEAQRRKRLVRARGTGRSHSSSLDNLLALTQSSQNLSSQNSLQDLSLNQDGQETQSEGSSTETDGADDGQTAVFGTDGQFDTVKRKKKKPRNLGTQSPRVADDRNKTPEPAREMVLVGEVMMENDAEDNSEDSDRAKTPQPECHSSSSPPPPLVTNSSTTSSSQADSSRNLQMNPGDPFSYNQRSKQQSRDSGFVGSCDDLLQHQKSPDDARSSVESGSDANKDRTHSEGEKNVQIANGAATESIAESGKGNATKMDFAVNHTALPHLANPSLSRKDSFNNWSSDEETNLMMSKMRQFFKTMVANSNGQTPNPANINSAGASPAPSPRLPGYSSKTRFGTQNRTKPPQLVYFENELTRLMKTVPGIRDEQVREIVEYLSSEDTWSDSYDSSDYTSSDLEGAAGGRRSALQEQISQSCQQIISKFDTTSSDGLLDKDREYQAGTTGVQPSGLGRDTAFVYQKLVQSFTKMAGDGVSSDANSTPHSSPPLIAKVMHHIGSRLVALMHEVSEGGPAAPHHSTSWRRYSQHHRTPSSASTTEDDDSTSDSTNTPSSAHLQLPRSKSHDPLLLINNHPTASAGQEGEEREASDYERFSWRGSFESALMAADSRTKLSLLACSGDVSGVGASGSASALAMAAKRRSAGDLLFNPKSFSREQLDRVRSCGSIGGGSGGSAGGCSGSIEERIWSNRRRSSVPDANTRGESGASAGDEDTEDELEYGGESRATTLPRGVQSVMTTTTNSLPRLPASMTPSGLAAVSTTPSSAMHKAHSVYHFLPQHSGVKSARYRPPGFARNTNVSGGICGPKRAVSAPGLQVSGSQASAGKRENSRSRRQQAMSLSTDDGSSLSEACSTPIIGAGSRASSSHNVINVDDMDPGLHSGHLATRASLSSLGARSDSMASVYSGAGEGRCCRSVVVTGEVEFALQYDYKHLTFEVHVTKCKNLAPVDIKRKRSDPYVKVYLLPDKSKSGKRKTKVKKHTLNPEFNETLKFHMSLSGLETRTLWLTVWHSDMFGRNDFLGEVRMPLENKIFDDPTPKWYPLQERTEPFDDPVAYKGEVIVGLKFVPPDPTQHQERELVSDRASAKLRKNWSRGALHVLVKEARNLQTRGKNSGTCDPFCKSYLLPDKGRAGKQKTGVVRRSGGSPVWGHTFIYKDVSLQDLTERGLELTIWDHDRIASNEFLGGVRFNLGTGKHYGKPVDWMDATGRELSLWQSMLERPNFWVEGAVTLRPNLHSHGKNNGP